MDDHHQPKLSKCIKPGEDYLTDLVLTLDNP